MSYALYGLAQSTPYEFKLLRMFKDQPVEAAFTASLKTVEALTITSATIAPDQKVFGVPDAVSFTVNRPTTTVSGISLEAIGADGKRQPIPVTQMLADGVVTMNFSQAPPRSATLELKIYSVESADSSYMPIPFTMSFTTSGGPQVTSINIGAARVAVNTAIVLTFDTVLYADQPLQQFIQLETPNDIFPAAVTAR